MKRMFLARTGRVVRAICPKVPDVSRLLPLLALLFLILLIPSTPLHAQSCWAAWNSSTAYNGGAQVSYSGENYQAAYWTQNQVPSSNSGAAGSGQPWIPEGSCSGGSGGATPTPTVSGGCNPTAITPYVQVNGGSWMQTASATVSAGASVNLGPQPISGTWSWAGPNGYTSTSRQIGITVNGSSTYTATYTNSCGAQSTQAFTLMVTGSPTPTPTVSGCSSTAITPYIQVNGGSWMQTASTTVGAGASVNLGPQPVTGGSWSWTGPNGYSSTSRQIGITVNSTSAYTATYTNSCGAKSTQTFTLTVAGTPTPTPTVGCSPTSITPYIQVNGGSWQQTASATVSAGSSVNLGPQPVTGGSWSWTGPNGYSSTSRQIGITVNSSSTYTATYTNSCGAQSSQAFNLTVTSSGCGSSCGGGGSLPAHVLMGYWQDFTNGAAVLSLAQVPTSYNIIAVAFGTATTTPGQVAFSIDSGLSSALGGYSASQFISDINTAHGRGQKVVLSVGGQNGAISVSDSASASNFANSVSSLMSQYGFDGVDIDLESGINPSEMAAAISQLKGMQPNALVTAAPQTVDTMTSGDDYYVFASDIGGNMTMMNTQYYNSGSMNGCDGNVYSEGTENFITALACTQLQGLAANTIGVGLPASSSAAGSGYVSPSTVVAAIQCLAGGSNCGSFHPPSTWPGLRGVMTWSINWDASNGYNFANTVAPALSSLP